MALLNEEAINKLSLIERAKLRRLPDYLTIIEIAMLYYGDPLDPPFNIYGSTRWKCCEKLYDQVLPLINSFIDETKLNPELFKKEPAPTHGVTFVVTRYIGTTGKAKLEQPQLGYKIHKDKFGQHLKEKEEWPIKPDNLLAAWWADEEQVVMSRKQPREYDKYKNSINALVDSTGIDMNVLRVVSIFNQLKQTDKELWDIEFATFKRDIWPSYSKENNLVRQHGRPKKLIKGG